MKELRSISVIIPVYNAESSVAGTVECLLSQGYEALEVILVDDGSTDGSGRICDGISKENPSVKVIHKPNGGVSSARNAGLEVASGYYVMFLDADDLLKPGTLESMGKYEADMVMAGFEKIVDGKVTETNVPALEAFYEGQSGIVRFLDDNIGEKDCYLLNSSCFKLYRKELIDTLRHRFDEDMKYGEDKLFVFRYLPYVQTVATLPVPVYEYILHKDSLSSDVSSDAHIGQILKLMERYEPILEDLAVIYPESVRLQGLYHCDIVSRYVFRVLTCLATGKSSFLNRETIAHLYSYMTKDKDLSLSSVRFGQIPNFLLFKIGSPRLSEAFYCFTSSICRYISFK